MPLTMLLKAIFSRNIFGHFLFGKDHNSLKRFIMEDPHATAIRKFTEWAGEGSAFVEWTSPNNTIDWREASKKLEIPTYYYKK